MGLEGLVPVGSVGDSGKILVVGEGGGSLCSLSAVGTNRRPEAFGVLVFTPSIWLIAALRVAVVAAAADFGVG